MPFTWTKEIRKITRVRCGTGAQHNFRTIICFGNMEKFVPIKWGNWPCSLELEPKLVQLQLDYRRSYNGEIAPEGYKYDCRSGQMVIYVRKKRGLYT